MINAVSYDAVKIWESMCCDASQLVMERYETGLTKIFMYDSWYV